MPLSVPQVNLAELSRTYRPQVQKLVPPLRPHVSLKGTSNFRDQTVKKPNRGTILGNVQVVSPKLVEYDIKSMLYVPPSEDAYHPDQGDFSDDSLTGVIVHGESAGFAGWEMESAPAYRHVDLEAGEQETVREAAVTHRRNLTLPEYTGEIAAITVVSVGLIVLSAVIGHIELSRSIILKAARALPDSFERDTSQDKHVFKHMVQDLVIGPLSKIMCLYPSRGFFAFSRVLNSLPQDVVPVFFDSFSLPMLMQLANFRFLDYCPGKFTDKERSQILVFAESHDDQRVHTDQIIELLTRHHHNISCSHQTQYHETMARLFVAIICKHNTDRGVAVRMRTDEARRVAIDPQKQVV